MDDATLIERRRTSQMTFYRALGSAVPGSRCVQVRPGVQATVVPAAPSTSLPNAVVYRDPAAVLDAHDELVALYAGAGVTAWTVWVVPGDEELVTGLEARHHALDGSPALMVAPIDAVDLALDEHPDLSQTHDWELLGALNERAWGAPVGAFSAMLSRMSDPALRAFVAQIDGAPVAGLATVDGPDGDCALELVATVPEARGLGLASALVRYALRDARARGCDSVSLEGSKMGESVYTRIGYRTLGRMRLYERRSPA